MNNKIINYNYFVECTLYTVLHEFVFHGSTYAVVFDNKVLYYKEIDCTICYL